MLKLKNFTISKILFIPILIGGCSSNKHLLSADSIPNDLVSYVANDFAHTLPYVRGKAVHETNLSIGSKNDRFSSLLLNALKNEGYSVIITSDETHENYISYVVDEFEENNRVRMTFRIKIGHLQLIRQYSLQKPRLIPSSKMTIEGDIFLNINPNKKVSEIYDEKLFEEPINRRFSKNVLEKSKIHTPIDRLSINKQSVPDQKNTRKIYNINELGKSNYQTILSKYKLVDSYVISFENESSELTRKNKERLAKIIKYFDKSTDVISIVGYSRGYTRIINGNEILASERADVLRSEIMTYEVPSDKILYEPFWSKKSTDGQIARGANLSIFRRLK